MRPTRTATALLATLALAAAAATGCGEKEETLEPGQPREVSLMLDYFPNADHAGFYAAEANGDFAAAGLDVTIRQPPDPAAPIKQVAAGRVDLAISYEPEVLRARDQGLPVVAVGAVVRKPLTSIMSLPKAGVRTPADLAGKTVGTAGIDYQSAFLRTILIDAGVDPDTVTERNVGFNFTPAMLTGRVDATLGAFWNYEGTQLRLDGRKPRIVRLEEAGVPNYDELVLVANQETVEEDGEMVRAFVAALGRGTRALQRDPAAGVDALLEANPDLDPRLQREVVRVTLPLFLPPEGRPFGWQDPTEWQEFTAWMRENEILTEIPDAGGAFTNEFLPGQGL
ncbi:MAG: ABC transporter substrate-binding protein [Solirubrobacterales bacterium]|nr:ABC transporter substrate-binding protein [Solirubrobacterales bacterium]